MNPRSSFTLTIVLITLLLLSTSVIWSMDSSENRASLAGLSAVGIVVIGPGADAQRDALLSRQLQSDLEAGLIRAGLKLLSPQELRSAPGRPVLVLTVNTVKSGGSYVFDTSLELRQSVSLSRSPDVSCISTTWSAQGTLGIASARKLAGKVRDSIAAMTAQLAAARIPESPKK